MEVDFENKVLKAAIAEYGDEAQEKMLLEEMAELQKEICKNWRGQDNIDRIAEELADVEIMIAQMKMIFGIAQQVSDYRVQKVQRLHTRLNGIKEEQL